MVAFFSFAHLFNIAVGTLVLLANIEIAPTPLHLWIILLGTSDVIGLISVTLEFFFPKSSATKTEQGIAIVINLTMLTIIMMTYALYGNTSLRNTSYVGPYAFDVLFIVHVPFSGILMYLNSALTHRLPFLD